MSAAPFDVDRVSDWLHAVEQWQRGDARAIAAFVLHYGVQDDAERRAVADMLAGDRPDARRATKGATEAMLRDFDNLLRQRRRFEQESMPQLAQWIGRVRLKLAARGMRPDQIEALLQRHRPGYLRPTLPTMAELFAQVASLHCVEPESVERALRRRSRR